MFRVKGEHRRGTLYGRLLFKYNPNFDFVKQARSIT